MNRRAFTLVELIILIAVIFCIVFLARGCVQSHSTSDKSDQSEDRFDVKSYGPWMHVITDKTSGVQYLEVLSSSGVAIIKLETPNREETK